ncbi:MAG TPA: hypothetical protein VN703_05615, partial [Candidatus Sulfopaludibacter sp.]|nr:hypothetical protein [Candidatus Sulfopaludibacter sp.]
MHDYIGKERKDYFQGDKENISDTKTLNVNEYITNEKKESDKLDFLFDKQNELFKKQLGNNKNKMQNL